jgi:hypothetical protein
MPSKYPIVEEAARHCWSKNFLNVFRDFYARNADVFMDAPAQLEGEQNLQYYALYQEYLRMYEGELSEYIRSLDVSITEFYRELSAVKDDPEIKDKKLLHFVDYLIACTDYPSFYKVMVRAAKKQRAHQQGWDQDQAESKDEGKSGKGEDSKGSKSEGKDSK